MPTTVIANATIVTGDADRTVLYDSAIVVEDDRIAVLGPTSDLISRYPNADVVNGRGKAVFPGLINCHAHLVAVIDRGITEDFTPEEKEKIEELRKQAAPDWENFLIAAQLEEIVVDSHPRRGK